MTGIQHAGLDGGQNVAMAGAPLYLVIVVCVLIVRRRWPDLEQFNFRYPLLLAAAIVLQVLAFTVLSSRDNAWPRLAYGTSQILVVVFLARNWRHRSMKVLGIGAVLNTAVILANQGQMAASAHAFRALRIPTAAHGFEHSAVQKNPRLLILGDRIVISDPSFIAAAYSIGDFFIYAGFALLLWDATSPSKETN